MEDFKDKSNLPLNGFSPGSTHSLIHEERDDHSLGNGTHTNGSNEVLEPDATIAQRKFREFYKVNLANIESCDDESAAKSGKLRVLLKYLEQLEEQNDYLLETVVELEKESRERVRQMERRLKSSAKTTMESVINLHQWEQEMQRLVNERLQMESSFLNMQRQVSSTSVENNFLRDQNFNLNHDIQALLHIIQHARSTGHWEMDCVTFCEVTPEQVFGPMQSHELLCSPRSISPTTYIPNLNGLSSKFNHHSPAKLSESGSSTQSVNNRPLVLDKCRCSAAKSAGEKCLLQQSEIMKDSPRHPIAPRSIFRSFSLPALRHTGGRLSFPKENRSNSKSCSVISSVKTNHVRNDLMKTMLLELPEDMRHSCESLCRSSYASIFRRAYSEPHLFMFGDCIYVYRPCETIRSLSSLSIKGDAHDFQPCRSIDLKLPSESQDCERAWGLHPREHRLSCSSLPHSVDQLSKDLCSLSHSKDFQNSMVLDKVLPHEVTLASLFANSKCQTDESFPVRNSVTRGLASCEKSVISCCVQTESMKTFTVGLQANISDQDPDSLQRVLSESTIEGMTIADVNKSIQMLKTNLQKAEDQVSAQTILIQELQGHLNTSSKSAEMKDAALENIEKKLNVARSESRNLRLEISIVEDKVAQLNKTLEEANTNNNNLALQLDAEKKKVEELLNQEKTIQNQKRSLMTQLDAQGDEVERQSNELKLVRKKLEHCNVQIEQQNQIIHSLQEALVQNKRAFDELRQTRNHSLPKNDLKTRSLHSSRNVIVDL